MRVVLVGKTSFIGKHIQAAAQAEGLVLDIVAHDCDLAAALEGADAVVNCAMPPVLRNSPYDPDLDFDLKVARKAVETGACFTMLSSRRVYPAGSRWNARESSPATGDETLYGRNKALSEERIKNLPLKGLAVFRMSNIFGYEYGGGGARLTFMGQLLFSLRKCAKITFNMHPDTQRDFLSVERAASAIVRQIRENLSGVRNLGCGFPVRCGDFAQWVMEGYGSGELVVNSLEKVDEFYLNMDRGQDLDLHIGPDELRNGCITLGRRLKCEKS